MKKILLLSMAFVIATFMMSAQDMQQDRDQVQLHEYLMLKDGKMYQVKGPDQIQLKEQYKMQNGSTVNPDGSYQMQNQKQQRLKNGECLDMDGNKYKNQQEFGQQMQYRAQINANEHMMFQGGQMYRIRNQEKSQLKEAMTLQNGTKVNPDGNVQFKDQKQQRLRDGECLDMDGNRYKNQQEFGERMYYRAQAMGQEHLMFQGGQMYRIRNQEKTQLNEAMTLQNGTKVNPDGNIQLKDQKQQRLRDGECLDMQGNRYENQDRFRDGMEKQNRERMGKENDMDKGKGKNDPNGNSKGKGK